MICPKCGFEQPDAPECARCGIIIAKYRAREQSAPQDLAPGVAAPSSQEQDLAPGWAGGARTPAGPGQGQQVGSRFTTYDRDSFRKAQAQEATRKFITLAGVIGGIVIILAVGVSFMSVYNNFAKLEAEVNNYLLQLSDVNSPALASTIMDRIKFYKFEIEGGELVISLIGEDGQDIETLTDKFPYNDNWSLIGKIDCTLVGKAVAVIPIKLHLKSSQPFVTRISANELRTWAGLDRMEYSGYEDEEEDDLFFKEW